MNAATRIDPRALADELLIRSAHDEVIVLNRAQIDVIVPALAEAAARAEAPLHPKLEEVLESYGCTGRAD